MSDERDHHSVDVAVDDMLHHDISPISGAIEAQVEPIVVMALDDQRVLMRLRPDGEIEFPSGEPGLAAHVFAEEVQRIWRQAMPEAERRLADALREVQRERDELKNTPKP